MKVWEACVLGLIQGLSEFIPISSSGHLSIIQNLFGMEIAGGNLLFDVMLHFGTLISVCAAFWKDILSMFHALTSLFTGTRRGQPRSESESFYSKRLILMIIIATLPMFLILPVKDNVEKLFYSTVFIGCALIMTGAVLYVSDKIVAGRRTEKSMTMTNALIVGICQAVAVIPGLSRSGSTITGGIASGLDREFAVKFSFLISIPAVLGASLISIVDAIKEGVDFSQLPLCLLGMAIAAVSGYFAIGLVKIISRKGKFGYFAYYCWGVGIMAIILDLIF